MRSSGSNTTDTVVVDPKLLHLVRKLMIAASTTTALNTDDINSLTNGDDLTDSHHRHTNCDYIVAVLRTQHREYQRKDISKLTSAVEAALTHIRASDTRTKKRKQDEGEAEYDRAAAIRDTITTTIGGGLNASLRSRYKQVSLDQSRLAEKAESCSLGSASSLASSANKKRDAFAATKTTSPGNGPNTIDDTKGTGMNIIKEVRDNGQCASEAAPVQNPNSSASTRELPPPSSSSTMNRKKVKRIISRRSTSGAKPLDGAVSPQEAAAALFMVPVPRPTERYADLGGMSDIIQTLRQLVEYPVTRPELYRHLGVDPPRGVLLRGPPGT